MTENFTAILFDMDGVLIDSMGAHARAWRTACSLLGIEVVEREIYLREGEKEEISARDFIRLAGLMSTKARVRELIRRKNEEMARIRPPSLFPGAADVVGAFHAAGFAVGLVTGSPRAVLDLILPASIQSLFATSVCGDEILRGKPNPEPYLTAIMNLAAKPAQTVVVENAPFGIQSARTAGAHVVAVRSYLDDADLKGAHRMVNDIRDLPALFGVPT